MKDSETLRAKLNGETGRLVWKELEKHYARGVVVKVAQGLDLVDVALQFAEDNKTPIEKWLTSGEVARAMAEDAKRWVTKDQLFWAVVVAPWVLVQELNESEGDLPAQENNETLH